MDVILKDATLRLWMLTFQLSSSFLKYVGAGMFVAVYETDLTRYTMRVPCRQRF